MRHTFLLLSSLLILSPSVGTAAGTTPPPDTSIEQLMQTYLAEETKNASEAFDSLKAQLGPSPDGFEWALYRRVIFLKPKEWNSLSRGDFLASAYGTSPEQFTLTKNFEMGFTIQVQKGTMATKGVAPRNAVLGYLKPILDTHSKDDILMLSNRKASDTLDLFFVRYKDAPAGRTPIIVHKFIEADGGRDEVRIYIFESPASTWDDNWIRYGTPMLNNIRYIGPPPKSQPETKP